MKRISSLFLTATLWYLPCTSMAQYAWQEEADAGPLRPLHGLTYREETQVSYSNGTTPLWLQANKYGLSSLERWNGYLRGAVERPLQTDSARRWALGYGVDMALPIHYTSKAVVQQAYVEARWLHGVLSVGAKERPMELKNNVLSSGSQTLGINARPVPQVRLALPEYWTVPCCGRWFHLKGHIAYGLMTDDSWQHEFTVRQHKYADHVFYHSKAGYLMIGNPDRFVPWSVELGLEMASTFGGTAYHEDNGHMVGVKGGRGLKAMWHALLPGGQDAADGQYGNVEGDQVGSWLLRWNYEADSWALHAYADHFFEDHSAMLMVDYDGYGKGDAYNEKKDRRFYLYDIKDMMLGVELDLKNGTWLREVVCEYLYTKYQSGPYNHDHTRNIPDHMAGTDNYYNHYVYTGWQHWGQVIGNPLYRSPLYNTDGTIEVKNNRFMAFHLGVCGQPASRLRYRALVTYQEGFGTYEEPYDKKRHNISTLLEATYRLCKGWQLRGAYAMDFGSILGHHTGAQFTVIRSGLLGR